MNHRSSQPGGVEGVVVVAEQRRGDLPGTQPVVSVLGTAALALLAGACDVEPEGRAGRPPYAEQGRMHVEKLPVGASIDSCDQRCGTWTWSALCQCDALCVQYSDCCADVVVACDGAPGEGGESSGGSDGSEGGEPPAEYCDGVSDDQWSGIEQEAAMLAEINERREHEQDCGEEGVFPPAPALEWDAAAQCAARNHSMDMAEREFFGHDDPDGRGPGDRLELAGSPSSTWGENIHGGSSTAKGAVDSLMGSDGHCANIMSSDFTRVGLGYHPGPTVHPHTGGPLHNLWTQVFRAE